MTPRRHVLILLSLTLLVGCNSRHTAKSVSMEPTIAEGESFRVAKYDGTPERGLVVAFKSLEDPAIVLVKRVIAVGGEQLEIDSKQVLLNGKPLSEHYTVHRDPKTFPDLPSVSNMQRQRDHLRKTTIPDGHVFVMGDNRDLSFDSRNYGPVPLENIVGRVILDE